MKEWENVLIEQEANPFYSSSSEADTQALVSELEEE
jgi:hypothetical protein